MQSKKQRWAKERNFLIWRVKGLISHQFALRDFLPDSESKKAIDSIFAEFEKLLGKIKKMDEFEKYQRYMKDNGWKI